MTIDRSGTPDKPVRHKVRLIVGLGAFALAVLAAIPLAWGVMRILWDAEPPWTALLFIVVLVAVVGYGLFGARLVRAMRRRREKQDRTISDATEGVAPKNVAIYGHQRAGTSKPDIEESRRRPTIFISSSAEGSTLASAVRTMLEPEARVLIWTEGRISPGMYALESLREAIEAADFAVLLVTPDETAQGLTEQSATARDNIILELGMLLGRLGRERTFLMTPRNTELRVPTDLSATSALHYEAAYFHDDPLHAIRLAASGIRRAVKAQGLRSR